MNYVELKDDISRGARGIYLLEGEDAYFRTKAEEQIKQAFLQMPELNYTTFDGATAKGASLGSLTAALSAVPFMSPKRIVKITDFYPTESDYEKYLQPFFDNFPEDSILIIVNSQTGKGVDLKRKKSVTYVNCKRAEEETVAKWVYITLKRAGVACTAEACEAVARYCVCDMSRVSMETEKLIEWGKGANITKAAVDDLVYKDAEYRIYEMSTAIAARDYGMFMTVCKDLLSKGFDENAILSSLLNYFKNLLSVLTLGPDDALAKTLKMSDWVIKKNAKEAKKFGKERLCALIDGLYSLISSFKGGLITKDGALESGICRIFFPDEG